MKQILILAVIFSATNAFGQAPTDKTKEIVIAPNQLKNDTTLKVVYANKTSNTQNIAWFINGKFVSHSLLGTLNPNLIDSLDVVKGPIQIDNVQYNGQIHIKTKSSYNPKLISMTDLKEKYTNLKNKPAIFMIDSNLVDAEYDKYMVDENYLLTIIVDNIKNPKENIDIAVIKLVTKTDENIKKSKEIRIRGSEVAMNQ